MDVVLVDEAGQRSLRPIRLHLRSMAADEPDQWSNRAMPSAIPHAERSRTWADVKLASLSVQDFKDLVRQVVMQALSEVLGYPDEGSELRDDLAAELRQSLRALEAGGKTTPVQEVAARLGLSY